MKREIKFRGLRIDGNGFSFGDLLHDNEQSQCSIIQYDATEKEPRSIYPVIPETVGQFTEKIDDSKEGKGIFDGDIVRVFDKNFKQFKSDYRVVWRDYKWFLVNAKGDGDDYGVYTRNFALAHDIYQVIGNVYENHELLTKQ
jgi:uncharacterized phage protein (TIGR01671 family)